MHLHARLLLHHLGQQFHRPSRPRIAKVRRLAVDDLVERRQVLLIQLGLAVVLASILQAGDAVIAETPDHAADPGDRASDAAGDFKPPLALAPEQNDLTAVGQSLVCGLLTQLAQLPLDRTANANDHPGHTRLLS
jgi:hypothetical protein